MPEDTDRPLSSAEMIRKARRDLEAAAKETREGSSSPVPLEYGRDLPVGSSMEEPKPWRDPVPPPMPPRSRDGQVRRPARTGTPIPVPPTADQPSTGRAAALVAGILVALIGLGVALAIALANGGG